MVDKADLYTHLHSVEENLFENELRCRWPDSNVLVETMVAGNSSSWLIVQISQWNCNDS